MSEFGWVAGFVVCGYCHVAGASKIYSLGPVRARLAGGWCCPKCGALSVWARSEGKTEGCTVKTGGELVTGVRVKKDE
jgi:hypothetical protein